MKKTLILPKGDTLEIQDVKKQINILKNIINNSDLKDISEKYDLSKSYLVRSIFPLLNTHMATILSKRIKQYGAKNLKRRIQSVIKDAEIAIKKDKFRPKDLNIYDFIKSDWLYHVNGEFSTFDKNLSTMNKIYTDYYVTYSHDIAVNATKKFVNSMNKISKAQKFIYYVPGIVSEAKETDPKVIYRETKKSDVKEAYFLGRIFAEILQDFLCTTLTTTNKKTLKVNATQQLATDIVNIIKLNPYLGDAIKKGLYAKDTRMLENALKKISNALCKKMKLSNRPSVCVEDQYSCGQDGSYIPRCNEIYVFRGTIRNSFPKDVDINTIYRYTIAIFAHEFIHFIDTKHSNRGTMGPQRFMISENIEFDLIYQTIPHEEHAEQIVDILKIDKRLKTR